MHLAKHTLVIMHLVHVPECAPEGSEWIVYVQLHGSNEPIMIHNIADYLLHHTFDTILYEQEFSEDMSAAVSAGAAKASSILHNSLSSLKLVGLTKRATDAKEPSSGLYILLLCPSTIRRCTCMDLSLPSTCSSAKDSSKPCEPLYLKQGVSVDKVNQCFPSCITHKQLSCKHQ